jgi:hypothetical protein
MYVYIEPKEQSLDKRCVQGCTHLIVGATIISESELMARKQRDEETLENQRIAAVAEQRRKEG